MINDVYLDAEEFNISIPISFERLDEYMRHHAEAFNSVTEPCLIHWDLWNGNIIVDGGRITGILDFERVFWGDPLMEFNFGSLYDGKYFLLGYKPDFGSEKSRRNRRILYDLYHALIMNAECKLERYKDSGVKEWVQSCLNEKIIELNSLF
jgi:aminoglycoside phosphotransferase (APT) family kinase protein